MPELVKSSSEPVTLTAVVPPEPPDGSVVLDNGLAATSRMPAAWQRVGANWLRCGTYLGFLTVVQGGSLPWSRLVTECGPLTLIHSTVDGAQAVDPGGELVDHDVQRLSHGPTGELVEYRCSCGARWSVDVDTCPVEAGARGATPAGPGEKQCWMPVKGAAPVGGLEARCVLPIGHDRAVRCVPERADG